ncbi:MAG: dTDP-4-dehydrorhamnose 3,5-epimerase [Flavobacteriales bacterium]|nr:dTDP-4-dehydrorhamnose 3,5-epimerase [Flavobacteriales bacterium]
MKIESTSFRDLKIITPDVFGDDRGYFFEPFNEARFRVETGLNITFVQDNESLSRKNVLRGLHFQVPPKSQAKLIRVTRGAVLDVVVDLRKSEPTFGKHYSIVLSSENKQQLFVPEGFAHGFYVLEDQTIFSYKCSNYYSKEHDRSILWNDPAFGIDWNAALPELSDKDKAAMKFAEFDSPFF